MHVTVTGIMAFENWSMIINNASQPLDVGSPVTISMEMWVHGLSGTAFGFSGAAFGCMLDFVR